MASSRVLGSRLEGLWKQAREPVFLMSTDCKLIAVNRAWEALTGYPAEQVTGMVCRAHGPTREGDLAGLAGSFFPPAEALAGQPAGGPTLIIHASGERRWRRVEFWPFHDDRGALLVLFGMVRDSEPPPLTPDSEAHYLRYELLEVRNQLHGRYGFDNLIGHGLAHQRLLVQVRAAAETLIPVLIVGEPGTGKRLVARTIHQRGVKHQSSLLPFDCAALPPEVLERELFGEGGVGTRPRMNLPEGSTLLIGDILDLPRDLQGRLAALADHRVRLLATTTGDPETALQEERLRSDLYYALTTLVIRLNPLRQRLDELPVLAQHLLERANQRGGRQRSGFSPEALTVFLGYDWPGNLRELARVIDSAHGRGEGDLIAAEDLPAGIRGSLGAAYTPPPLSPPLTPLDDLLTQVERRLIEHALVRARQNKSKAADLLHISRPRLYRRIKELGIPDESEPVEESQASGSRS